MDRQAPLARRRWIQPHPIGNVNRRLLLPGGGELRLNAAFHVAKYHAEMMPSLAVLLVVLKHGKPSAVNDANMRLLLYRACLATA